jgi:hypothetical protein
MAAPVCLEIHFKGDLARCVEASHAGVEVLRRHGIQARVVPCAVVVAPPKGTDIPRLLLGHNAESTYALINEHSQTKPPPFEEWQAIYGRSKDPYPLHVVIRAQHAGEEALIDLTLGQLIQVSGGQIRLPKTYAHFGKDWPIGDTSDGSQVVYMDCPYPDHVEPKYLDPEFLKVSGLGADLYDVTQLALLSNLDLDTFAKNFVERCQVLPEIG